MSETYDAIVIGAGIVGSACAYACAIEGMRVAVIEGGVVGGGATGAGMGHIVVMDDSAAQFELTRYSRDLWKKLGVQLPPEAEYRECGTIWSHPARGKWLRSSVSMSSIASGECRRRF